MKQTGQPKQILRSGLLQRQQQQQQQNPQQPIHDVHGTQMHHQYPQHQQPVNINYYHHHQQQQHPHPYIHEYNQQQFHHQQQQHLNYQYRFAHQPQYQYQPRPTVQHPQQPQQQPPPPPHQQQPPPHQQQPKPQQKQQQQQQVHHQKHEPQKPSKPNNQKQKILHPKQPQQQQHQQQHQQRNAPQNQQNHRPHYPGPRYNQYQGQNQSFNNNNNYRNMNKRPQHRDARNTHHGLRKVPARDRALFAHIPRIRQECICNTGLKYLGVPKLIHNDIRKALSESATMEDQIVLLREKILLNQQDFQQRVLFTQLLLDCLQSHHNQIYEGVLFGSTINGLGFKDSDVDLRLRLIKNIGDGIYEPQVLNDDMVDRTLRDIAYQTNACCPCEGEFVPSSRCPVAKLSFMFIPSTNCNPDIYEGLKYDVSLSSNNSLGSFNTLFLRFLCYLEPKFHLLATVIRYWTKAHELIVPGYLSSYAMINMLIYFCQVVEPPILPTVDQMRELYLSQKHPKDEILSKTGLTQLEWHCIVCLKKELYTPSKNTDPLSVLLLKFFEFYLKFPYSTQIITTRPGKSLTHDEFKGSTHFHPRFPIRTYINIQDPFDLRHNLTSGMNAEFFKKFMSVISHSYEVLFFELINRFRKPDKDVLNPSLFGRDDPHDWGLSALFVRISSVQMAREPEVVSKKKKDKKGEAQEASIKKPSPPITANKSE